MTDEKKIELVTLKGVEIMETGQFACASGVHDFTAEDLASAVAALDDPGVHDPRLKLGHVGEQGSMLGMPVFGKFVNMATSNEGHKLTGDIIGVPDWLGKIMPTAYPSRSIEGRWNYTSATGVTHKFVILAVSLLGVELPGIATLEDLETLYADGPEGLLVEAAGPVVATYGQEVKIMAGKPKQAPAKKATAAVDPQDVRRAFYEDFATEESGRYWWWIHELYIDPAEIIAEDEEGSAFYRLTYSINGDEVTFGDPVEVKKTYVEAAQATASGAATAALTYSTRAESRPNEENGMQLTDEQAKNLRVALGLPEDATEEQINEKLNAAPEPVAPSEDATDGDSTPAGDAQPEPVAAGAADDGIVRLDKASYDALMSAGQAAQQVLAGQTADRRKGVVDAAVQAGKIPPARHDHYMKLMELDEEGTAATLASLQPGLIPVAERGTAGSLDASAAGGDDPGYPTWLTAGAQIQA